MSRSRSHQRLHEDPTRDIPGWLMDLLDGQRTSEEDVERELPSLQAMMQVRVADEVEVRRWCID